MKTPEAGRVNSGCRGRHGSEESEVLDAHISSGIGEAAATQLNHHISVCICTYKRPHLLERLLNELRRQQTEDLFTYSVVIVDNDQAQSAKGVVSKFASDSTVSVKYCVEPQQNIALARNLAVENTDGDFVAFIDDDEFPSKCWLITLFHALNEYSVDGVLGPVLPHFDDEPPQWVVKGKFYERPTYPTGFRIDWRKGRTGNVLLKRHIFSADPWFRPEFRTGEDQDFFRRAIEKGHVFIWCNEALAHEVVAPTRWKRKFMLRRALLRGSNSLLHPTFGALDVAKSIVAVPVYFVALPFAFILGHHRFMDVLIRLCDHLGKLLACLGINPVREPYVTE
jgi:succinoglycan biosynthesis protein ExoM